MSLSNRTKGDGMAMDLWGDIPGINGKRGPVDVLVEQSAVLKEKTGGLVGLRVYSETKFPDNVLCCLKIPGIDSDASDSIAVIHGKDYPCLVSVGEVQRWANSEGEFMEVMRGIFQSDSVREKLADVIASAESILTATEERS